MVHELEPTPSKLTQVYQGKTILLQVSHLETILDSCHVCEGG